jgi:hypothetical protein
MSDKKQHGISLLRTYLSEIFVLLLAAITRFWRLDYHSFWFDEAVSLQWARSDASYIWQSTFPLVKDKHPPAYYLLLHGWSNSLEPLGLDRSDVALRALGALLGVFTVLGVLLLARRVSGRPTALLAGVLIALSPALAWYSQELRMFQPATTCIVWAAYFLLRAWQSQRRLTRLGWWLAMIAAFTFALYSYLFSAFVLPAAGLALVGLWLAERLEIGDWRLGDREIGRLGDWEKGRAGTSDDGPSASSPISNLQSPPLPISQSPPLHRLLEGIAAFAITGLLFLPLARNAWLVNDSEGAPGQAFMNFSDNMQRQLQVFTVWRAPWLAELTAAALVFFGLLALTGVVLSWPRREGNSTRFGIDQIWLLLWIGVPLLIGNLLLAVSDTVFAEDRYFLFLAPFVLWAVARGVMVIGERWQPAAWAMGATAALLLAAALPVLWSPAMLREDWRAAAHYIAAYQQRSPHLPAAVFVHAEYTNPALRWYLHQLVGEEDVLVFYPYGGTLSSDDAEVVVAPPVRGLEELGIETLWLVQSHLDGVDDSRVVQTWLSQHYPVITEQHPAGIQLTGYALRHRYDALPELSPNTVMPDVELAPNLRLVACEVLTPELTAADERMHPPSGWVHVRLWWQAIGAVEQAYMPVVQMVGPEGVWGDRLYRDGETLRRDPPTQWPPGVIVRDAVDVNLNPVTPPGDYPIVVGLRDEAGNDIGGKVECGRVRIVR